MTFLTEAPGVTFLFSTRTRPTPSLRERMSVSQGQEAAQRWLVHGLTTWGAGAKTAAGYGYFERTGG